MNIRQEEVVPTYEYKCRVCLKEFDVRKNLDDLERKELCVKCGGKTQRQLSTSEIIIH
jgi:putative FmdB family regulatory protein